MNRAANDPLLLRGRAIIEAARAAREAAVLEQELALLEKEAKRQRREAVKGIPQPRRPDMVGLRECNGTCGEWKPLDEENFFRDKDGPGGFSRKCKDCDRAYQRERRARIRSGEHAPRRRPYPRDNGRWPGRNAK